MLRHWYFKWLGLLDFLFQISHYRTAFSPFFQLYQKLVSSLLLFHFKPQSMCSNFRGGGLQYILYSKAELKDKESVHWCLEIAISYFSLVSPSPNMRLIGGRKNVLETQVFGVGATSYDSFFGAGRLFINTSFLHPSPAYSFFATTTSVNLPLKLSSFTSLYSLLL